MGVFKRLATLLIGELDGQGPTQPDATPQILSRPPSHPRKPTGGTGGAEVFRFHEGLTTGGGNRIGKHSPISGTAVVEILTGSGQIMALDVFEVVSPAPRGPWKPLEGVPATYVVPGNTNRGHQEFEFRLDGPHPLKLPEHLAAKTTIGGVTAKVWWSCT